MPELVLTRPEFSELEIRKFLAERFGLEGTLRPLDSERDQNWLLQTPDQNQFVVRIANQQTETQRLEFENRVMLRLSKHLQDTTGEWTQVPTPVPGRNHPANSESNTIQLVEQNGQQWRVRLTTFIPGRLYCDVLPQTPSLQRELGRLLGRIDLALAEIGDGPALENFQWDLDQFEVFVLGGDCPEPKPVWQDWIVENYRQRVKPHLQDLRKSWIHNDANDHNIIVSRDWPAEVVGLIDFGDMVHSSLVNELAIAMAYVMLEQQDPLQSAVNLVSGYQSVLPLTDQEIHSLFPLACARLMTSVVYARRQQRLQPENQYLGVTLQPATQLLERLYQTVDFDFAEGMFRVACGRESVIETKSEVASPVNSKAVEESTSCVTDNSSATLSAIRTAGENAFPILGFPLNGDNCLVFDLSVSSSNGLTSDIGSSTSNRLFQQMREADKTVGVGRYLEPRICYQGNQFGISSHGETARSIHLGIDLFVPAGDSLYCPLDGEVHSFADNAIDYDYGPTIILKHRTDKGQVFYSLYGHLSRQSLSDLKVGQLVTAGSKLAQVGAANENGGWPPHVHFQIMTAVFGMKGDFPGVAKPDQIDFWKTVCPDPNLILKISVNTVAAQPHDSETISLQRSTHVNPSLSLSYQKPLHIVRGMGSYLYDAEGQAYLDCVNNVCHVGHCHPKVVAAGQKQMQVLNTNTRYLHENIGKLAESLTRTLPKGLDVCYFVNSGSEANDLALRLARNFVGRSGVACVDHAYHGHLTSLIEISPYKFDRAGGQGCPANVRVLDAPDVYRGKYRLEADSESLQNIPLTPESIAEEYVRDAAHPLEQLANSEDGLAALICESILSCGGQIDLPAGYLAGIYQKVRALGGVCIADEVQVGFGRVGDAFWAFEKQKVVPDIVTMGKPMGNGHPLAAVVTTREIANAFQNGMEYFNTFGGNPVSCAIGMEVLNVIADQQLQRHAAEIGDFLIGELRQLESEFEIIGDVRGRGLFLGIEIVKSKVTREPHPTAATYLVERMKELRILLSTDGPANNVIKFKPPMVFDRSAAESLVACMRIVLGESYLND